MPDKILGGYWGDIVHVEVVALVFELLVYQGQLEFFIYF
jgi:hypothetical protein